MKTKNAFLNWLVNRFLLFLVLLLLQVVIGVFVAAASFGYPINLNTVSMLKPALPVDRGLQQQTLLVLSRSADDRQIYKYAVTGLDYKDSAFFVSVAGFPGEQENHWFLDQSIWLGVVVIERDLFGNVLFSELREASKPNLYEGGGAAPILPFRTGTTATYGLAGIHDCGFHQNGWKSVDLFPQENMIYVSEGGPVTWVCRDNVQMALRIGNNLYTHLQDNGINTGHQFSQGDRISGLVAGSFEAPCGYANQSAENAHVHFCFIPGADGSYFADGYLLNVYNGNWTKEQETVSPGDTLTAAWQTVTPPGPAIGANFWDGIVYGFTELLKGVANLLPKHDYMGMAEKFIEIWRPVFALIMPFASLFNLTIVAWCIGIILALEVIRIAIAAILWVYKFNPLG